MNAIISVRGVSCFCFFWVFTRAILSSKEVLSMGFFPWVMLGPASPINTEAYYLFFFDALRADIVGEVQLAYELEQWVMGT